MVDYHITATVPELSSLAQLNHLQLQSQSLSIATIAKAFETLIFHLSKHESNIIFSRALAQHVSSFVIEISLILPGHIFCRVEELSAEHENALFFHLTKRALTDIGWIQQSMTFD